MKKTTAFFLCFLSAVFIADAGEMKPIGNTASRYANRQEGSRERVFDTDMVIYRPNFSGEDRSFFENALTCFAKGVYEASDGKHKIGTIRIARTDATVRNAEKGRDEPAMPSGISNPGILFSDTLGWPDARTGILLDGKTKKAVYYPSLAGGGPIWTFGKDAAWGGGTDIFLQKTAGALELGLTLAHEWGHAVYGFRDEYVYKNSETKEIDKEKSVASLMGTGQTRNGTVVNWVNANFSIEEGSGDRTFWTKPTTHQHETYQHSCWKRLTGLDPVMYGEKSAFATPTFECQIGGWEQEATRSLKIVWLNEPLYAFLIDTSGSMDIANRLENAKKALTDALAKLPGDAFFAFMGFSTGVADYGDFVPATAPQLNSAKQKINALEAFGGTSIYDAVDAMIDKIEAYRRKNNSKGYGVSPATIVLLTDGEDNSSQKTLAEVKARVAGRDIHIDTIPFGTGANPAAMQELADSSGGKKLPSGDSLSELSTAFSDSLAGSVGRDTLKRHSLQIGQSGKHNTTIPVDSGLADFVVTVTFDHVPKGGTVRLVNPKTGKAETPAAVSWSGGSAVYTFRVDRPAAGSWTLSMTGMAGATTAYRAEGRGSFHAPRIDLYRDKTEGAIYAHVSLGGVPVAGASVSATAYNGKSSKKIAMAASGPGLYKLDLASCGNISGGIVFEANAAAGKAVLKHSAGSLADAPPQADAKLRETFARAKFLDFSQHVESTVTFDPRGGKVSPKQKSYKNGASYGYSFPIPVRKGYAFNGWHRKVTVGSNSWEEQLGTGSGSIGSSDIQVYAKWTKKKTEELQSFFAEGGTLPLDYFRVRKGGYLNKIGGKYYYITRDRQRGGKMLTVGKPFGALPKPTRKGYTFAGWHCGSSSGRDGTWPDATKITSKTIVPGFWARLGLHAHWKAKTVKVSFSANGGKASKKAMKFKYGSKYGKLPTAKRAGGYQFAGWYTAKTGGTRVTTGSKVSLLTKLHAHWVKTTYTITLDANGGKITTAVKKKVAKAKKKVKYGKAVGNLPEPTKNGYAFLGWYTEKKGGRKITASSTASGDRKLYARWTKGLTVRFVYNDGTGRKKTVVYPESLSGAKTLEITREGHVLRGWYLVKNSTSSRDLLFLARNKSWDSAVWEFNWPTKSVKRSNGHTFYYETVKISPVTVYATWDVRRNADSATRAKRSAPCRDQAGADGRNTYFVAECGSDAASGLTSGEPLASIQRAVELARDGDEIIVAPGDYPPFDSGGKTLEIVAEAGPGETFVDAALLWADGITNRCATLGADPVSTNTVLAGFSLLNGIADMGGGNFAGTLEDCILKDNSAAIGGGAYGGILIDCILQGNAGRIGGAACAAVLLDCTLRDNVSSEGAAAEWGVLENCDVDGADAGSGGP